MLQRAHCCSSVVSLLVFVLAACGCGHPDTTPGFQSVLLYEFADHRFAVTVPLPDTCSDRCEKRLATGYHLFSNEAYQEASECFGRVFHEEHNLDAGLMCGVSEAKQKNYEKAAEIIQEVISKQESYPTWRFPSSNSWPRMALIWCLCKRAEHSGRLFWLEEAEKEAISNTHINDDPIAWIVLKEVRKQKSARERKETAIWCFGTLIIVSASAVVLFGVCSLLNSSKGREQARHVDRIRTELQEIAKGKEVCVVEAEAALVTGIAQLEAATFVREKTLEVHLNSCKTSFDIINELVAMYQRALRELNTLSLSAEKRHQYRAELESNLKAILASLVSKE